MPGMRRLQRCISYFPYSGNCLIEERNTQTDGDVAVCALIREEGAPWTFRRVSNLIITWEKRVIQFYLIYLPKVIHGVLYFIPVTCTSLLPSKGSVSEAKNSIFQRMIMCRVSLLKTKLILEHLFWFLELPFPLICTARSHLAFKN